jgi:hypothetical protein
MAGGTEPRHTPALDDIVRTRALRFSAAVQGLVTGLLAGLAVFVATNWLILKGGTHVGRHLALLGQFFIGYRVTFVGSLIGFGYAFVLGYIVGYGVASMYNAIAGWRDGRRLRAQPRSRRPD